MLSNTIKLAIAQLARDYHKAGKDYHALLFALENRGYMGRSLEFAEAYWTRLEGWFA